MKPATQKGSGIPLKLNAGLETGTKLRKAALNLSDNPKLSALLNLLFLINLFQLNDPPPF